MRYDVKIKGFAARFAKDEDRVMAKTGQKTKTGRDL
jgi:hypothetical protein